MEIPTYIAIQGSYTKLQLALFKGDFCLEQIEEVNKKASSLLIPLIKKMLDQQKMTLDNIDFIATDQGPGAFTSLRVTISTINGISFAKHIPLIGIDGLQALLQETNAIPLLNAYNNEVYYALNNKKSYKKIDALLDDLQMLRQQKIMVCGNGAILHKNIILEKLKDKKISFLEQSVCSTQQIATMALQRWHNKKNLQKKLYPLYLKSQHFAIRSKPHTPHTA
jgi:tRNA threonylcarbamoyladenosine biosynthesis protein TsaB